MDTPYDLRDVMLFVLELPRTDRPQYKGEGEDRTLLFYIMFIHTKRKENTMQIRVSKRGGKRRTWLTGYKEVKRKLPVLHQPLLEGSRKVYDHPQCRGNGR